MRGSAMQAVIGGDRGPLPTLVVHTDPAPKPKGLDWAAISPDATESPAPVVSPHRRAKQRLETHCAACGRATPTKGICTHCQELEEARRDAEFAQPTKEAPMSETKPTPKHSTRPSQTTSALPGPMPSPELVDEGISLEVRTITETLNDSATSTDMVVAACRATVIAAADALRGALLRAPESAKSPGRPGARIGQKTTPGRRDRTPRIEDEQPNIVEEIRKHYVTEGRGVESVASILGISPNTVSRVMHRNDIPVRAAGATISNGNTRLAERLAALKTTSIDVRLWARKNNIAVADRGLIPEAVLDAFEKATRA